MKDHIFTCILRHLRVYYELIKLPAPSWLDSSAGRAPHRYRGGHGFEVLFKPEFFSGFTFRAALGSLVVCV